MTTVSLLMDLCEELFTITVSKQKQTGFAELCCYWKPIRSQKRFCQPNQQTVRAGLVPSSQHHKSLTCLTNRQYNNYNYYKRMFCLKKPFSKIILILNVLIILLYYNNYLNNITSCIFFKTFFLIEVYFLLDYICNSFFPKPANRNATVVLFL